jgi:hypothetical protein
MAIGCPPDFIALSVFAFAEGTIGRTCRLVIRPGFEVLPGSWYAVIGDSGTGKTPAQKYAQRLVTPLEDQTWETYQNALDDWKRIPEGERGEKPALEHFIVTDSTGEALWDALASSPGVTLVEDELRRRLKALDAYRKGGDRQAMLSLWSNATVKIIRRTSAPRYIPSPVASMIGGIQPGVLRYLRGEGDDAEADDGWVPRFLLAWPDAEPLDLSDVPFDEQTLAPATEIFTKLRHEGTAPHDIWLSPQAYARFKAWHGDNRRAQLASHGLERQWAAKAPIHLARLALVLHLLADPEKDRDLSSETMAGAIEVLEYFRGHLARVLPTLGTSVTAGTQTRILRILRTSNVRTPEGWVTRSDIGGGLRNVSPAEVTEVLEVLQDAGIVEKGVQRTATKPIVRWRMIPETQRSPGGDDSDYSDYSLEEKLPRDDEPTDEAENPNNPNSRTVLQGEIERIASNLGTLTAEEIAIFRQEIAEARDDDPNIFVDREALKLFDVVRAARERRAS